MKLGNDISRWIGTSVLVITGCYTGVSGLDGDEDAHAGESGSGGNEEDTEGADSSPDGSGTGSPGDSPPEGCLPGALGCECLDGTCAGLSACVEGICTAAPPAPEIDGPSAAIAGLTIRLDGEVDAPDVDGNVNLYEQLLWSQVDGPAAAIEYEFSEQAVAYIPGDAPVDAELVFRLEARLGDVTRATDYTLSVLPATATGPMDGVDEIVALGASVMARGGNADTWFGTSTGTLVRANNEGVTLSEDLGSRIAAIQPYRDGLTLIALPDLEQVAQFNQNNNTVSPFLTELSGGAPLGPVSSFAVDGDGNVYLGTEAGNIVLYTPSAGAAPAFSVVLYTLEQTPTALALGQVPVPPDIDDDGDGLVLYYGTSSGDVMQIGLTEAEVVGGPTLGVAEPYLDVPGAGPVTGLTVDELGNMWVGKTGALVLVRRGYESDPVVARAIDMPSGLAGFSGLQSRNDDEVVWIDPASGRVASLRTQI
jgi:hypothetical protein